MKRVIFAILTLISSIAFAQDTAISNTNIVLQTTTGKLSGSLSVPTKAKKFAVVLIIAGSGPTDRNGNIPAAVNANSYKILADSLLKYNIASVRFDKRGVGESKIAAGKEEDLRFEGTVNDAADWIALLKKDKRFTKIIVAGHSEGSFVGMMAAKKTGADKYISIAGAGLPAHEIIKKQLEAQPKNIKEMCIPMLDTLASGKTLSYVPAILNSLFRPSVQPYLISWFRYDPRIEISKLTIPVLIINGITDIQVSVEDAGNLHKASKQSKIVTIEGMGHLLKEAPADRQKNIALYNTSAKEPIKTELVQAMITFIKGK
jgi:uncharacterized protein